MHLNSILMFRNYAKPHFKPGRKVLEIGPDGSPSTYCKLADCADLKWETIDMTGAGWITFKSVGEYDFGLPENSYDLVLSGQVIEHVRKPWVWLKEVARVCKPGGKVITINPVNWPYHEEPVDCWRAYPEGMKALYEDAGLAVELSTWESLEPATLLPRIPFPADYRRAYRGFWRRASRRIKWPVQRAYDCITIGTKLGNS